MNRTSLSLLFLLALALSAGAEPLAWRGVWEWSMDKRSDDGLVAVAEACQRLGFNVLMTSPPRDKVAVLADECHRRGMKLYLSTVFSGGDEAWRQVMTPEEQARAEQTRPADYQQGGEPLSPDEVFASPLPCWRRPEVHDFFRAKVLADAALPVDGLAFDYVGYQNYHRCYCPVCEARLAIYRQAHRGLTEDEAAAVCAEDAMVEFVADMAYTARQAKPGIELTIHVYPWFRPHPYHGNRLAVNYAGQTVSWFFPPHWRLDKVRDRTAAIVGTQHWYLATSFAAPFLGFYSTPPEDLRSPERMRAELRILRESGAEAMQMAELGHIVRAPEVAKVVAEELGGKS